MQERKVCLAEIEYMSRCYQDELRFPRYLFDDERTLGIVLPTKLSKAEVDRVCAAFPEAKIVVVPKGPGKDIPWVDEWERYFPPTSVIQAGN